MGRVKVPDWEDPRRALGRHGLRPKRSHSQNFLVSRGVVDKIVSAVAPREGQAVVELGPGVGTLTGALLRAGARVIAVEQDRQMLEVLAADFGHVPDLRLVHGDAATVDLTAMAKADQSPLSVVGNVPYAITGAILRNIIAHRRALSGAVLMVQREVRDRLVAKPDTKTYGALTVFSTAAFDVQSLFVVRPGSFHPAPKVSSAVLRFSPLDTPRAEETAAFRLVVRGAFATRRKTLRNALQTIDGVEAEPVAQALAESGIAPNRRGESLSVEEFATLARHLSALL